MFHRPRRLRGAPGLQARRWLAPALRGARVSCCEWLGFCLELASAFEKRSNRTPPVFFSSCVFLLFVFFGGVFPRPTRFLGSRFAPFADVEPDWGMLEDHFLPNGALCVSRYHECQWLLIRLIRPQDVFCSRRSIFRGRMWPLAEILLFVRIRSTALVRTGLGSNAFQVCPGDQNLFFQLIALSHTKCLGYM